jgi:hypothetical protein
MARQLLIFINVSTDKGERSEDFEDTKRYRRRKDNTKAKRKSSKGQTTIDKTYI